MTELHTAEAGFVTLTWQVGQQEHATVLGSTTRGALRQELTAKPSSAEIASATATEMIDAERILDELRRK
jgi:hypothetical protein